MSDQRPMANIRYSLDWSIDGIQRTYDAEARAGYLQLNGSESPVYQTVQVTERVYVDVDLDGHVLGVEVLGDDLTWFDLALVLQGAIIANRTPEDA